MYRRHEHSPGMFAAPVYLSFSRKRVPRKLYPGERRPPPLDSVKKSSLSIYGRCPIIWIGAFV